MADQSITAYDVLDYILWCESGKGSRSSLHPTLINNPDMSQLSAIEIYATQHTFELAERSETAQSNYEYTAQQYEELSEDYRQLMNESMDLRIKIDSLNFDLRNVREELKQTIEHVKLLRQALLEELHRLSYYEGVEICMENIEDPRVKFGYSNTLAAFAATNLPKYEEKK